MIPFVLWQTSVRLLGTSLPVQRLFAFLGDTQDPAVIAAYAAPFPSSLYKAGTAMWPLLVPLTTDAPVAAHMLEARQCLAKWKKPVLVMFGDKDPVTYQARHTFLRLVPHAKEEIIRGAGHFLQESHGEQLATNVINFLKSQQ